MLQNQESRKTELLRERRKASTQLERIDRQIAALDGAAAGTFTAGGRIRNEKSLVEYLVEVLEKAPKGLKVGDIVTGVQEAGYKTNSVNFRSIVNQMLIKEKKKFSPVERGVYAISKR
jgi:hypothetical protein